MFLKYGIVKNINPKDCTAKVLLPDLDNMLSPWLQLCYPFAYADMSYFMPKVGSQVACILDENLETGVIIGSIYNKQDSPPVTDENKFHTQFEDGTVIEYDKKYHKLDINVKGSVNIKADGAVIVDSPETLIKGNLKSGTGVNKIFASLTGLIMVGNGQIVK